MYRYDNWLVRRFQNAQIQVARTAPYQHEPLPNLRSFRLLKLPASRIIGTCSLETHSLDEAPAYMALSYTWGSPIRGANEAEYSGEPIPLRIRTLAGDKWIFIGRNLYNAPVCIAARGLTRYLWVDAVCINQSPDSTEKAAQIPLMGDIYPRCQSVIAWLGDDDVDFDNPRTLHQMFYTRALRNAVEREGGLYVFSRDFSDPAVAAAEFGINIEERLWRSYHSFFEKRRWFSRVWMVQEVALPPQIKLLCGVKEIGWPTMSGLAMLLRNGCCAQLPLFRELSPTQPLGLELTVFAEARQHCEAGGPRMSQEHFLSKTTYVDRTGAVTARQLEYAFLEHCLSITRTLDATDERDTIYGALGMFTKFHSGDLDPLLVPDYTLPAHEVYTRAAWLLIRELPYLSTMSTLRDPLRPLVPGLPSWVPDYSYRPAVDSSLPTLIGMSKPNASRTNPTTPAYRERNGPELHLEGAAFDFVNTIADTPFIWVGVTDPSDALTLPLQALVATLQLCTDAHLRCKDAETAYDTLFLTLLAGVTTLPPAAPIAKRSLNALIKGILAVWIDRGDGLANPSVQRCLENMRILEEVRGHGVDGTVRQFPTLAEIQRAVLIATEGGATEDDLTQDAEAELFSRRYAAIHNNRRLYRTMQGHLGLGPLSIGPGDQVWVVRGATLPLVLREAGERGRFTLVGDSYLHGFMHGEMLDGDIEGRIGRVTLV